MILGLGIFVTVNNSKDKVEYDKSTGTVEYYDKEFLNLPTRHKGDFRYVKIDSYPYVFEIYKLNSEPAVFTIDDLKVGDEIDVYYYETSDTRNVGLNRFAQFIDKNGQPYFVRSGFQKYLGFVIVGLSILLNIIAFLLWKKGMLKW
ncbi:hypothetical protein LAG90_10050 [Marinilongibacter aquaticus]|uniref:hypothetical protein n=1 Tax=Marinilongibacter aquaticus TaxID=2975157 RepID=UPI0021BD3586|nr:hypothetical protein [Marinilongibacter aquaticus]UBM60971.1 hypothetical protein LAG90_10050 [Marinilongibacter aquaticus]